MDRTRLSLKNKKKKRSNRSDVNSSSEEDISIGKSTSRIKSNACITQVLESIPSKSSFTNKYDYSDDNDDDSETSSKEESYIQTRFTNQKSMTNFGLNVGDDHFVIDGIKNRSIPREDGYAKDFYDKQHWNEQPYGKSYYNDQLTRIQILNDSNEYTFIRYISGACSLPNVHALFDEEDMDRYQEEKEEARMRRQLELKRQIVSVDQKTHQLKSLEDHLNKLRGEQLKMNNSSSTLNENTYQVIYNILHNGIDSFSGICNIFDEYEEVADDDIISTQRYSYTNVLDWLYILSFIPQQQQQTIKISFADKLLFIREISDSGDEDDAAPLYFLTKKLKDIDESNKSDVNEFFMFVVCFVCIGQEVNRNNSLRLIYNTFLQLFDGDEEDAKKALKLSLPKVIPCEPLASLEFMQLFEVAKINEIVISACKTTIKQGKGSALLTDYITLKLTRGDIIQNKIDLYNDLSMPDDLVNILKANFGDKVGDSDRIGVIKRYFVYKWLTLSSTTWVNIKPLLIVSWDSKVKEKLAVEYDRFYELNIECEGYIASRLDDIHSVISRVLPDVKLSTDKGDKSFSLFDRKYRSYKFLENLKDHKFKAHEIRARNKEEGKYHANFSSSPIHAWLDMYLRYHQYIQQQLSKIYDKITEVENAINQNRNIVMNVNNERRMKSTKRRKLNHGGSSSNDNDDNDDDEGEFSTRNPEYKQRKSFTSRVDMCGIVRLSDFAVTHINKAYINVQKWCPKLRGLPLKEFHNDDAMKVGLACTFADYIATLMADTKIKHPNEYKTKAHQIKVTVSMFECMQMLKTFSFSTSSYMNIREYHIFAAEMSHNSSTSFPSNNTAVYGSKRVNTGSNTSSKIYMR